MNRDFHTVRGYQILNADKRRLTSSMEDYLEMIYRTCSEEGYSRINQLAEKLHVQPSSATKIVQKLAALGFVDYQKYGIIRLTEKGNGAGAFLLRRHEIIEEFFRKLGILETLKDTEMIEHDISIKALQRIHILNEFLTNNPDVLQRYQRFEIESSQGDQYVIYPGNA